jgi:PIN domain nuclease of toxin-antitoxin system
VRYLLDTHTLIWAQDDPAKLGSAAARTLRDPDSELLVSIATIWELGIKIAIGKLQLSLPFRPWVEKAILDLDLIESPIRIDFVERQVGLPFHHRDPFDRLLVAQALVEGLPLVGGDAIFDTYGVTRIWD